MTKKSDHPLDPIFKLSDAMFGNIEELSPDEVRQMLSDAECDTGSLRRRLYEKAIELRGAHWAKSADPPGHLKDFLEQLRPADLPTKDPALQRSAAHKWLTGLFGRRPVVTDPSLVYAFRDKADTVTDDDVAVLKDLAEQLKKKVEGQNE